MRIGIFMLAAAAAFGADKGFTSLFDGKTLNGWKLLSKSQNERGYVVQNGAIVCPLDGGGNLLTEKEYANFVLRFEFKMEPGGNNGIGIRAPQSGDIAYTGMEIQVLDHDHEKYKGRLKPTQFHGSVYDVLPAKPGALKPAGQWNSEEIIADGSKIKVTLNGKVILDGDLSTVTDPEVLKKHPGIRRTSGHIGFLGHKSLVEFRNIRIKELP
ncbi:MAG: DUF1080 domain-containing protein [Acidobacteria bacterium]|nr:DUF1080 domain-containing protein [Acidobacteriota bacterium]